MDNIMPKAYVSKLPEGLRLDETPQHYYVGARKAQLTQNCTDLATVEKPIYSESCEDTVSKIFINDENGDVYVPQPDGQTYGIYEMETGYGFWNRVGFWSHSTRMGLGEFTDYTGGNFGELTEDKIYSLRESQKSEVYAYIIDKMFENDLVDKPAAWSDSLIHSACTHWTTSNGRDHNYFEKALVLLQKIAAQSSDRRTVDTAIEDYQYITDHANYEIFLMAAANQSLKPYSQFNKLTSYIDNSNDIKGWENLLKLMQECMNTEHASTAHNIAEYIMTHSDDHLNNPAQISNFKAQAEECLFLLTENPDICGSTRYYALEFLSNRGLDKEENSLKRLRKGYLLVVQSMANPGDGYFRSKSSIEYLNTKPQEQDINEVVAEIFAPILEKDDFDYDVIFKIIAYKMQINESVALIFKCTTS